MSTRITLLLLLFVSQRMISVDCQSPFYIDIERGSYIFIFVVISFHFLIVFFFIVVGGEYLGDKNVCCLFFS